MLPLVTHDELRPLLGAYAAGALAESAAEAVRAHLASGCTECLHDIFSRPVGLPRGGGDESSRTATEPPHDEAERHAVHAPPPAPVRRGRRWGLAVTIVVLALALATFASWTIYDLREREAARHAEAVRLAARVSERHPSHLAFFLDPQCSHNETERERHPCEGANFLVCEPQQEDAP